MTTTDETAAHAPAAQPAPALARWYRQFWAALDSQKARCDRLAARNATLTRERDDARAVVADMIAAYRHLGGDRWASEVSGSQLPAWHDRAGLDDGEARDGG